MVKQQTYDLVIVESPAKAKTIEKFLGSGFVVKSSYGHIRDLKKNKQGVDIENNYEPQYEIPEDKDKVVSELLQLKKKANSVWLASDEDREGEAISWHLAEVLGLDVNTTKRIVFHEITKEAILNAIKHPRTINMDLVDAQQARRVLDRLVGFELSPVLWRKVKPSLSAGRVQSVAVRILVEREREIYAFKSSSSFSTTAEFNVANLKTKIKAELNKRFKNDTEAEDFLQGQKGNRYVINGIEQKPTLRTPAAPFTTSTLQQEASRKLGFPVSLTMSVAQKLYEAGHITYMRTDSVNLAEAALKQIEAYVMTEIGKDYLHIRHYKTKQKGAQEAHEAIRPTYISNKQLQGVSSQEQKLYNLIWQRTIASQMADAQIERTVIKINATAAEYFTANAEVVKFDGFMKVYTEASDDDDESAQVAKLPKLVEGQQLELALMESRERFAQHAARYNEATLVKKLEELGVGRPSTYAPTISTIQQRGYVIRESRDGEKRNYKVLSLAGGEIQKAEQTEIAGAEKNKLFPTDIGMLVDDFLHENFSNVINYDFTAQVEQQFDEIAEGNMKWQDVIDEFYKPFHGVVNDTIEHSEKKSGERILGTDPKSGKQVSVRVGRFGPMAQIGDNVEGSDEKPQFASLLKDQRVETITLEEALKLFDLPRHLGEFEGKVVVVGLGKFGPYIRHDGKFTSLKKGVDDPYSISLDVAVERIEEKRLLDAQKLIKEFAEDADCRVLNGRWGAYIAFGKDNVKIPKGVKAEELTYEKCVELRDAQLKGDGVAAKKSASAVKKSAKSVKTATKSAGTKGAKSLKVKE